MRPVHYQPLTCNLFAFYFLFRKLLQILLVESIHSFGLCLLLFRVLPCLDTVRCLLLMNALCSVPAIMRLFATKRSDDPRRKVTTAILDVLAVLMQLSAYVIALVSMKSECVKTRPEDFDNGRPAPAATRGGCIT